MDSSPEDDGLWPRFPSGHGGGDAVLTNSPEEPRNRKTTEGRRIALAQATCPPRVGHDSAPCHHRSRTLYTDTSVL